MLRHARGLTSPSHLSDHTYYICYFFRSVTILFLQSLYCVRPQQRAPHDLCDAARVRACAASMYSLPRPVILLCYLLESECSCVHPKFPLPLSFAHLFVQVRGVFDTPRVRARRVRDACRVIKSFVACGRLRVPSRAPFESRCVRLKCL